MRSASRSRRRPPPTSPSSISSPRNTSLAALCGFSALGGEVVLLKLLDEVVGSAPLVAFAVLAIFILGMGVGAQLAGRVRRLWRIEAALCVYHLVWVCAFSRLLSVDASILGTLAPWLGPSFSAALLGGLITAPVALMLGIVFPSLVEQQGQVATPYAICALGSTVAVLVFEAIVYPQLGVRWCLGLIAATHAVLTVALALRSAPLPAIPLRAPPPVLIWIGVGTGMFQGAWLLLASILFRPAYFIQPLVIATMVLGISLGSLLWLRRQPGFAVVLSGVLAGIGLCAVAVVVLLHIPPPSARWGIVLQLPLLILPAAIPIGALLPAFLRAGAVDRSEAGAALLAISIGNAIGALLMGGVVLRLLSPLSALLVVGVILAAVRLRMTPRTPWPIAAVAVLALCSAFADDLAFIRRQPRGFGHVEKIETLVRGPGELAAIYRVGGLPSGEPDRRLYQSGYSAIRLGTGTESVISLVGAAYSPTLSRALVLGAGSGRSAGTAARLFDAVDVVDIGATVPELLRALPEENFDLLHRPNVTYHAFDAILAPTLLRPGYDLIVMTLDPSYIARAGKLYTVDALQRLQQLLRPGGVLVFWSDVLLGAEGNQVLINTAHAVFAEQKLFSVVRGSQELDYYLLIGSQAPLVFHAERLRAGRALFPTSAAADAWMPGAEAESLLVGRAHPTRATHSVDRPASCLLWGGPEHVEPIPLTP